jgi:hypothetical protein
VPSYDHVLRANTTVNFSIGGKHNSKFSIEVALSCAKYVNRLPCQKGLCNICKDNTQVAQVSSTKHSGLKMSKIHSGWCKLVLLVPLSPLADALGELDVAVHLALGLPRSESLPPFGSVEVDSTALTSAYGAKDSGVILRCK